MSRPEAPEERWGSDLLASGLVAPSALQSAGLDVTLESCRVAVSRPLMANSPEADGRRMHDGGDDGAKCMLRGWQSAQDSAIDPS